jgi:hypothetical protein
MMQQVVNKIGNRLSGWKMNLLSYPGRDALIKSVLLALPTYLMTIFKLKNRLSPKLTGTKEVFFRGVMM